MSHKIFREWRVWFWYLPLLYALYLEMKIFKYAQGFSIDDAYIYLRYIHNLTQGFGLGFNPGEFSAGIPGFLYVILCAGVSIVLPSLNLFLILQFMGIFWYLVLIFLTQKLIHDQTNNLILSLLGGILLALCRPLYFTALSGLETPLFLTAGGIVSFYLLAGSARTTSQPGLAGSHMRSGLSNPSGGRCNRHGLLLLHPSRRVCIQQTNEGLIH